MTLLNSNTLKAIFKTPHSEEFLESLCERLNEVLPQFGINTRKRIAAFLAQCAHESGEFLRVNENLNYSAEGLAKTWPRRFADSRGQPNELAFAVQRKPMRIANIVYGSRMGNDNDASGDGYRYRGRGLFQLTGKDNYEKIGDIIGLDLVSNPDLAAQHYPALKTACAYWNLNRLSDYADRSDFTKITKIINGGFNGLKDREEYYHRALAAL